jgi:hypothetical protein
MGGSTNLPSVLGHGRPNDLADLVAHLLDGVHRPKNIKMLIPVDNFRVNKANMRLAATLEPV